MTISLTALAAYTGWTLLLLMISIGYRGFMVLTAKRRANAWTRGRDPEDSPFFKRAADAYANCLETAPLFAAVILLAHVSDQSSVTDGLAMLFVAARILQSVSHLISVNHWMVFLVRFPAFLAQVVLMVIWLLGLTL
jgi:uncharacterized MAPEG superfamily protein